MFIRFFRGIFLSLILIIEGEIKISKFIRFFRGIFLSLILIIEGLEYEYFTFDQIIKFPLIFLSISLIPPTIIAFNQKSFLSSGEKGNLVFTCFLMLLIVFWVDSIWFFFIFFELSVVPMLLIVSSVGGTKSRIEARKFLFTFTSGTSLIFLLFLVWRRTLINWETFIWLPSPSQNLSNFFNFFLSFLILLTFFVKIPSLFVHIWLPKAHVEAPVFGSIILARVMLKIGGYGILLFRPLLDFFFSSFFPPFFFICFSAYSAIICFRQKDLKILIAYSRVNHMALVLIASIQGWRLGFFGLLLLMLGHGVISSILFFLARRSYGQTSSRSLIVFSSRGKDYFLILMWIVFAFINIGFPPFLNFLGEVYIIKVVAFNPFLFLTSIFNFFIVGLYGVLIISSITQRKSQKYSIINRSGGLREFIILMVLMGHIYCFLILNMIKGVF